MKESTVEKYLSKEVKRIGGMCIKQKGTRGVPDRLMLYRGEAIFIEVKQRGGVLADHQVRFMDKLAMVDIECIVLWSKEGVDAFIDELLDYHARIELEMRNAMGELH